MDWKSTALEELDMLKLEDGIKIHESTKVDLDIYSRTNKVKLVKPFVLVVVGYEIMLEENTQCIASALRNAIINLDMVPKIIYQDNGRAFRAKYFTSDKGFNELGFFLFDFMFYYLCCQY